MQKQTSDFIDSTDHFFSVTLGNNLFDKSIDLLHAVAPVFGLGLSIYVLLVVWQFYKNGFDEMVIDGLKMILGLLLVTALAFNAHNVKMIMVFIYGLPDQLSAALTGQAIDTAVIKSNFDMLLKIGNKIIDFAEENYDGISGLVVKALSYLISASTIFLGAIPIFLIWAYTLVIKASLALTLMVTPLFIGFMMFPSTRQYGMNWIGQCLNYVITILLMTIISVMLFAFVEGRLLALDPNMNNNLNVVGLLFIPVLTLFFSFLSLIIVLSVPSIASALTGGASATFNSRQMSSLGAGVKSVAMKLPGLGKLKK